MPTHLVNLEALLPREDFEASSELQNSPIGNEIRIDDLEEGRPYAALLRKPDFQRVTTNWSPDRIADLIKSVVDADLIPALILWRSPMTGNVFVIDGAHRLSALLAWVRDDYGDGAMSRHFFDDDISPSQKKFAKQTRDLINEGVGTYAYLRRILQYQNETTNDVAKRRAQNLLKPLALQIVPGNAEAAENSFFRINGNPVLIDATELSILRARRKPNSIATRALMHAGKGHKYWRKFKAHIEDIESEAGSTYDLLFKPILDGSVKTLDVPVAGQSYSSEAFRMVFDLINMVNNLTPSMWESKGDDVKASKKNRELLPDDPDGEMTLRYIEKVQRHATLISGKNPKSLGLHPMVYFYGATGKFRPTAFLAVVKFFTELEDLDKLFTFTAVRSEFEEFLLRHRDFLNQLDHSYGSRTRPVEALVTMYKRIYESLNEGIIEDTAIVQALQSHPKLKDIRNEDDSSRSHSKKFTKEVKNLAFIRDALQAALKCSICGARLHSSSISNDHIVPESEGGTGHPDNLALCHFYCNTGYKERLRHESRAGILSK